MGRAIGGAGRGRGIVGSNEGRTRELLFEVLVVLVAVFVGSDVGAGFGVADVLHLVGVFFYAYLAEIPQRAHYC